MKNNYKRITITISLNGKGEQTISLLGDAFTWVGLALLSYQFGKERSAIILATALTLRVTAFIIFSPFAGVLADKIDHCASSCLKEEDVKMMAGCVQLDMECAAVCYNAAQLMSLGSSKAEAFCRLCVEICTACGKECGKHNNEHCRECADSCRKCAEECLQMAKHV